MATVVLSAVKDAQHADVARCLIHDEVEHGIVLGYMSQSRHDPWLKRSLKRNVAKPSQRILDVTKSLCRARQGLFDRFTKVAICSEQVIEDNFEICFT
jgi:hypothetical protein